MATESAPDTVKDLVQKALQANKDHQYALTVYTERLEAELQAVDKLLVRLHAVVRVFACSLTREITGYF